MPSANDYCFYHVTGRYTTILHHSLEYSQQEHWTVLATEHVGRCDVDILRVKTGEEVLTHMESGQR